MGNTAGAALIRRCLEDLDMRQLELAETLGVGQGTVSRWTNRDDPSQPQKSMLGDIEDALKLERGELIAAYGFGDTQFDVLVALQADPLLSDGDRSALILLYKRFTGSE